MTEKQYEVYDFRKAGSTDETSVSFKIWIGKASQTVAELWHELGSSDVSLKVDQINTKPFSVAMQDASSSSIACLVDINAGANISIWHITQANAQAIVCEMLGMPDDAELLDRPPTGIELSLCQTFFEFMLRVLGESWPAREVLPCVVQEIGINPKRHRLFRPADLVTTAKISLSMGQRTVEIDWVLPKQETGKLMSTIVDRRSKEEICDPRDIVEKMPVEIVGVLGEATLSINRLAALKAGDLVMLDQKIDRPIVATIDGQVFYECWPGKIGALQGIQIERCFK